MSSKLINLFQIVANYSLSPEYDPELGLITVGGRLHRAETLDHDYIHQIILDPKYPITKLIIKHLSSLSVSWEK